MARADPWPNEERLVPISLLTEATQETILLRCTQKELAKQPDWIETEFIPADAEYMAKLSMGEQWPDGQGYMFWPNVLPDGMEMPVEHMRIPPGELAVRRGTRVEATDGHVGQVDEFLVDPVNGHITHLVLREGHLWGQKDVTIPVDKIARLEEDCVHLHLDKEGVGRLTTIPVRRWWR